MGDRLPQALEVARQVSRYGGLCVVLIHPNILDHKLAFEKGFVAGVRPYAWFGSVSQFGQWWGARNSVQVDVEKVGPAYVVKLEIPQPLPGLTLEVPEGWTLDRGRSYPVSIDQAGRFVILQEAVGAMALRFRPSQAGAPRNRGA